MSGDGKRSDGHRPQATAPILDSTGAVEVPRCSLCTLSRELLSIEPGSSRLGKSWELTVRGRQGTVIVTDDPEHASVVDLRVHRICLGHFSPYLLFEVPLTPTVILVKHC